MSEYPTENELEQVRSLLRDDFSPKSLIDFLEFLRSIWWNAEWGFRLSGKKVLKLHLSTGGWSGNEDIIEALMENFIFWSIGWVSARRGGHYEFRFKIKKENGREFICQG
jgi:hypothetical protein